MFGRTYNTKYVVLFFISCGTLNSNKAWPVEAITFWKPKIETKMITETKTIIIHPNRNLKYMI